MEKGQAALGQLLAIGVSAWDAGDVIARAAPHEVSPVRVLEEDERRPLIQRAGTAGNLPPILQQRCD